MQSLTDGKALFTMDLLNPTNDKTNNIDSNKGVQAEMSEPKLTNNTNSTNSSGSNINEVEDDFLNVKPPDQSNLVIPTELIVVRKPNTNMYEDENNSDYDTYLSDGDDDLFIDASEQDSTVEENQTTISNNVDDEFCYVEPPKLAPVDQSLIFIRKPDNVSESYANEDIDIIDIGLDMDADTTEVKSVEQQETSELDPNTSIVEDTIVEDTIVEDTIVEDTDEGYDYFSVVDEYEGVEDFTDELEDEEVEGDIDEEDTGFDSDAEVLEGQKNSVDGANQNVEFGMPTETSNTNTNTNTNTNSEVQIKMNLDDKDGITYESEESKYNENKYRSDNIIRDYEEDNKYNYPLLYLSGESIEMYRVQALSGMLDKRSFIEGDELYYHVYVEVNGSVVYLGKLLSKLLRTILNNQTFTIFNKKIYLDPNTSYEGDMLYALSEIDIALLD